jgi:hypothetical protein
LDASRDVGHVHGSRRVDNDDACDSQWPGVLFIPELIGVAFEVEVAAVSVPRTSISASLIGSFAISGRSSCSANGRASVLLPDPGGPATSTNMLTGCPDHAKRRSRGSGSLLPAGEVHGVVGTGDEICESIAGPELREPHGDGRPLSCGQIRADE